MKHLILLALLIYSVNASTQDMPAFKQLRYDEDYHFLKNDSTQSWYKNTKYAPLSRDKNTYLSIGGEVRYQYQWFKNQDWGKSIKDEDGFMLTRYLVHADFHAGKHVRTFVQLQSSFANGMEESPSPVDENELDLHQAFVDASLVARNTTRLTLRVGRQELIYGSQRLVAVRDGPNNRQSFDAAKLMYDHKDWKADLFYSHYVRAQQKIFDDGFNKNTRFWGTYFVKNKLPLIKNIDLYYFGIWKRTAMYDDATGKELRHVVGSRIWNSKGNWRYDIEGLYQFGSIENKRIDAWTFSVNTGYKFNDIKFKPEPGLKTEFISGDKQYGDGSIQTFNPLFPRGSYFGLASLIGPVNLFDIHPSLAFELSDKLSLDMDCDIFYRQSIHDGIYGPNVALIYSGKNSTNKFIGSQYSGDIIYIPVKFLYFRGEFTWFKTGAFLKDVGAEKDILFTSVTAQVKF